MMAQNDVKRSLRRLELEAYCSVVSALRAQGDLTDGKRVLLKDLQDNLKISAERHRAEVRRAVNDDELIAIAASASEGIDLSAEWQLEGRRLLPSLPRHLQSSNLTMYSHSLSKIADNVRSLMSTRPTREARLEQRSVDSKNAAGRSRKQQPQQRFDDVSAKWSLLPRLSAFLNSASTSNTVTTRSPLSSRLTRRSVESLPASAASSHSLEAVVSVHETSVSSDSMFGHTHVSLDVPDSGPALTQTQQVVYEPMSVFAGQQMSSHDALQLPLDSEPQSNQYYQHFQPVVQVSQEMLPSMHPRHMLQQLPRDSLSSEQYVQLSTESLATSQHVMLCSSDADSQETFQLHDTYQSLYPPATTVSMHALQQVKQSSTVQGLNTSHEPLHQSGSHVLPSVHSPHNPSSAAVLYTPGYSMQQLQSEQAAGQPTSHNSSPVLSRLMPSTRVAPTHVRSAPPTPKVIIVSGTGMSSATTISGPPSTVTLSQITKPVPGKMAVIATSKPATSTTFSASSGIEPLPASGSPVIPVYSSMSASATSSAMHNVRPTHLFNPRSMPIFRPRPLTARIRTPHTSVSATSLQLPADTGAAAAASSSMIVSYKPAALVTTAPGHSSQAPAGSTTIILGHCTSVPAHSTVAILPVHDTIAPGHWQSAPLSSQTATLPHKGHGGSNTPGAISAITTPPPNLSIQLKSINSRHPCTDAVQIRQDGVGNLPSNRVILSEGTLRRNVIVVQKQVPLVDKSCETTATVSTSTSTPAATTGAVKISSPFEKELVSFIRKQDLQHGQYSSQLKRCSKDLTTVPVSLVTPAVSSAAGVENVANCSQSLRLGDSFVSSTCVTVTVTKNDVSRLSTANDGTTTDSSADLSEKNYANRNVALSAESQTTQKQTTHAAAVDVTRSHDHLASSTAVSNISHLPENWTFKSVSTNIAAAVVSSEGIVDPTLKSERNRRKFDSTDGAAKALKLATCKPGSVLPNIEPFVTNMSLKSVNAQLPICVLNESLSMEDNFVKYFGQEDDLQQPEMQDGQDKSSFLQLPLVTDDMEDSAMLDCDSSATASANSTILQLEYDALDDVLTGTTFTSDESTALQYHALNKSEECSSGVEQVGATSSVEPTIEAVSDGAGNFVVQAVGMQNVNVEECVSVLTVEDCFGVEHCDGRLGYSSSAAELDAVQGCGEAAGEECETVNECIDSSIVLEQCPNARNIITECSELAAGEYSSVAGRNSCKSDSDEYDESEPGTDEWVELTPDELDPLSAEDGDELTEDEKRSATINSMLSSVESLSAEQLEQFIGQKNNQELQSCELTEAIQIGGKSIQIGGLMSESQTELTVVESDSCLTTEQQAELDESHGVHTEQHTQSTEDVRVDNVDDFTAKTQTELVEIEPHSCAAEQCTDDQLHQITAGEQAETDIQPDRLQNTKSDVEQCHHLNELDSNVALESTSSGQQEGHSDGENKSLGNVDNIEQKLTGLTDCYKNTVVVDRNSEIDCSSECVVAPASADVNIGDRLPTVSAVILIDAINTDLTDQIICSTALTDPDMSDVQNTSDFISNQLHTPSSPKENSSATYESSQLSPAAATSVMSLGKRKRRPPLSPDHDLSLSVSGWSRLALSLLGRVMRFRCLNGDKNRSNPSAWFNQPVDADEVPDYYDIIQNPMDFGTIKKKLETSEYTDWPAFHADMMLVKENCHLYNAPGTQVRYDCDLVFNFYQQECNKMSSKVLPSSPVKRQKSEQQSH